MGGAKKSHFGWQGLWQYAKASPSRKSVHRSWMVLSFSGLFTRHSLGWKCVGRTFGLRVYDLTEERAEPGYDGRLSTA